MEVKDGDGDGDLTHWPHLASQGHSTHDPLLYKETVSERSVGVTLHSHVGDHLRKPE